MQNKQTPPDALPDADKPATELSVENFTPLVESAQNWFAETLNALNSVSTVYQLAAIAAAIAIGWVASRKLSVKFRARGEDLKRPYVFRKLYKSFASVLWLIFAVIILWITTVAFAAIGLPNGGMRIAASILNAGIIVRLVTANMKAGTLRNFLTWAAWAIAALYILKLLTPITNALDGAALTLGDTRISVLQIITGFIVLMAGLWIGRVTGDAAQAQLSSSKSLSPSMGGLLGQVAKVALMILAVVIALNMVGFNLAALAVMGGAIGVGIGLGLQSIFANFMSGIIILLEKSVKVGDFIELASGTTGQVKEINIRATLVNTNDDIDILVPNEEFIKAQVINWTLRDARRRLHVPFGVAYGTKKESVEKAGLEAAAAVEFTDKSKGREPQVWLTEFGDSSLNYELIVWLSETAVKKPGRVKAAYNWELHSALEKYGLEIPFPQRDLNIRQPAEITVKMK